MEAHSAIDVLVVGAGPVGLALAADLSRWGVSFRIVDRKPGPERHSRAGSFWPRTQEAAAAMGWLGRVMDFAVPVGVSAVHAFGRYLGDVRMGPYPSPYPHVHDIHQGRLERALVDHLAEAGCRVEYGAAVAGLVEHGDGVEATLVLDGGGPETIHCRYLVGCDGSRGDIRDRIGLSIDATVVEGRALQQVDARLSWSRPTTPDKLWFFLLDDGMAMVAPLPGGLHRVLVLGDDRRVLDREPTLREMEARLARIADDPRVALSDPAWFSHGRLRWGLAPSFQKGRVFLAGDAGHATIPIGGQGMNTGVHDAFNLGWKLAAVLQGRAAPWVLDSYAQERRGVRTALAADQAVNARRLTRPSRAQKMGTLALGPTLLRHGISVELGLRDETQLSVGYPDSPLSDDRIGGRGVRAGFRVPDAPVVAEAGLRPTTLFAHIYHGGWTLLGFDHGGEPATVARLQSVLETVADRFPHVRRHPVLAGRTEGASAAPSPALLDLDRHAHRALRVDRSTLVLVRPDGHVGFRGGLGDGAALLAYCERVFRSDGRPVA